MELALYSCTSPPRRIDCCSLTDKLPVYVFLSYTELGVILWNISYKALGGEDEWYPRKVKESVSGFIIFTVRAFMPRCTCLQHAGVPTLPRVGPRVAWLCVLHGFLRPPRYGSQRFVRSFCTAVGLCTILILVALVVMYHSVWCALHWRCICHPPRLWVRRLHVLALSDLTRA